MIRAIVASVLAFGLAGTTLAADRGHDHNGRDRHEQRHDRHDDRGYRDGRDGGHDYRGGRDYRGGNDYRGGHDSRSGYDNRYARPRHYAPAPRHDYRYRAPRPRGWYPGWREPYGNGYRYWNQNYYYVVPSAPSLSVSLVVPFH